MDSSDWFVVRQAASLTNASNKDLDDFNDEESLRRLAPLIYLGVLMIVGVTGNIAVLAIFPLRFPRNAHRTFVVGLAVSDIMVCLITIPFEIIEMGFQYTFYSEVACKIFRTLSSWFSLVSMFILAGMSYEKYKRICKPLEKQMTVKTCRIFILSFFIISLLFIWPSLLLCGIRVVDLGNGIVGHDCSLSDYYAKTAFPIIAEGALLLITIFIIGTLIIVYSMIGRTVLIQYRFRKQFQNRVTKCNRKSGNIFMLTSTSNDRNQSPNMTSPNTNQRSSIRRLTKIAFMVSLVFIMSYLPHLIVSLLTAIKGTFLFEPGPVVSAILPILARSFIVNNVANPIIYGFMDARFRKNIKIMLLKILFCRNSS